METHLESAAREAAVKFSPAGTIVALSRFGSGLINDTYLCELEKDGAAGRYILQRINAGVFRQPELLMENVEAVSSHIMDRLRQQGAPDAGAAVPVLVRTREGSSYYRDPSGSFWRMFHFIESGRVFDRVMSPDHAREVGRGLGRFQALVSDLSPRKLHDTLPGFHHTPRYLDEYDDALRLDSRGRASVVLKEAEFVDRRRGLAPLLTDLMNTGQIPVRVVHNDPKVNNVMIDSRTGKALCMLDLDTVKPGIVHFDFGDCVRSAANPAGEDADLDQVTFDTTLFRAVAEGYLTEARSFLAKKEAEMLGPSVKVITFELGLRFLADYLRGDTYFRISHPSHNLHRARVQFRLLEFMERADPASLLY